MDVRIKMEGLFILLCLFILGVAINLPHIIYYLEIRRIAKDCEPLMQASKELQEVLVDINKIIREE